MVDNPMYARRDDFMQRPTPFASGGATMSSGSGGSTKYMLGGAAPIHHPTRYSVMGMGRVLDPSRLSHALRTPTPEASRYEPNFMLGPATTQDYSRYDDRGPALPAAAPSSRRMRPPSPKPHWRSESRYMVRPKLNSEKKYEARYMLHPPTPELPRTFENKYGSSTMEKGGAGEKDLGTGSSLYDTYWHIPRATLWCSHKGCVYDSQPCKECQWKDDCSSTCSSVNPPPTFTALDKYQPVRPRPKCHQCSCGIIFAITTVFSLLVLLLITGFILYIEMVLKYQRDNVKDRM
ncbi:uncharacterized protein LOC122251980 isoform X2 [Penaeus japonicus]|uniref:uncharacterized protein LOC122251980 isoform X2 n=1 Tax=Penaeus japonicus TaxID=27405 RepID=UPI001C7176A9|nr:uncharacterized protein LOC122251980 isoform X2 [Penaeus japonicus]